MAVIQKEFNLLSGNHQASDIEFARMKFIRLGGYSIGLDFQGVLYA